MGVVWAGTHLGTGNPVALKFIRPHAHSRSDRRRRLLREARAVKDVNHPNLVRVHHVLDPRGSAPIIVMDLLVGETLAAKIDRDEVLAVTETADILLPVISAVVAAHAHGVVHRDLKPENIFLARTPGGGRVVKVLDFGVAKIATMFEGAQSDALTGTGSTLGTPWYMAPEQACGEGNVDYRADIWALGVILYECLSGGRPVEGQNLGQVVKSLLTQGITPLERVAPDLPADVAALVGRMLTQDREQRLDALAEAYDVLKSHAGKTTDFTDVPARARPTAGSRTIAIAVATVCAAATVLGLILRTASPGVAEPSPPPNAESPPSSLASLVSVRPSAPLTSASGTAVTSPVASRIADLPSRTGTTPRSLRSPPPWPRQGPRGDSAPSARTPHAATGGTVRLGLVEKPPF